MTNKLPVGRTIIDAYGFTFGQLGTTIGLIWFPMVLSTLLSFLPEVAGNAAEPGSVAAAGTVAVEGLAVILLTLLMSAVMYTAVARQALGLRQGPAVFHFALGQPEFRVYGALLMLYFLIVLAALFFVEGQSIGGPAALVARVVALPGAIFILYVVIRLGFLVVPAIVVESRIDFARVWALAAGNFWRIFLVLAAIAVPIWIIDMTSVFALMGKEVLAALPPPGTSDPKVIELHLTAIQDVFSRHLPELMGVSLILAPFTIGLFVSASASAYRALAGSVQTRREMTA